MVNSDKMMRDAPKLFDFITSNGFRQEGTGGGCDAFIACLGDTDKPHDEIWITDGEGNVPHSFPFLIGYYEVKYCGCIENMPIVERTVSTVAEAEDFIAECEGHSNNPRENGY